MTNEQRIGRGLLDFTDGTLFGNDAGEDELPDVLNSYFVDQPAFANFLSRSQPFRVARSRKGMGKSALISKLAFDLLKEISKPIVINITGAKLLGLGSGLIGYSQKMTVAARAMAEKKTVGHRS